MQSFCVLSFVRLLYLTSSSFWYYGILQLWSSGKSKDKTSFTDILLYCNMCCYQNNKTNEYSNDVYISPINVGLLPDAIVSFFVNIPVVLLISNNSNTFEFWSTTNIKVPSSLILKCLGIAPDVGCV